MNITPALLAAALNGMKAALDGGNLYYFAGAVPADANDALNMSTTHTQVAKFTESNDGTTGLTFQTATAGTLPKTPAEDWKATVALDGFDAGPTITPTFFRFCPAGDNGRGAGSGARVQGTLGGPSSGAFIELVSASVTANGSNTVSLPIYSIDGSALA